MKAVFLLASVLFCANAQIATTVRTLPDGATEIRMRNDSAGPMEAFAVRVGYTTRMPAIDVPLLFYFDAAIRPVSAGNPCTEQPAGGVLLPGEEFVMRPECMVPFNPRRGRPRPDPPVTGGHLCGRLHGGRPWLADAPAAAAQQYAAGGRDSA